MFEKVLSKKAKESLAILGESQLLKDAYLAGGTALCLQFGHRYSYDFDFFTWKDFDSKILIQRIKNLLPDFKLERKAWGTILGYIGKTRFSLFFCDYPLLFGPHQFFKIETADVKDIAPMKLSAISDRGRKRDFIDLYFIIKIRKTLTLEEIFKLYDKKFKLLKENKFHILKSLSYFEDADKDEMPKMIEKVKWSEVKKFFKAETERISKILLYRNF